MTPGELQAAARILAQGMRDNPNHLKVFGRQTARGQRRLLRFLNWVVRYVHSNGRLLGAYAQGELVGVLGMMKPGGCRPSLRDVLSLVGTIVTSNPPTGTLRILRWLKIWGRNDPVQPHWHLGPLAVHPAFRRRGIGRRLMLKCCQDVDADGTTAYLETDLEVNVAFYKTLGFAIVRQEDVLGVSNWFMSRPPKE
ncbi:GNAT family N-acetyltransferase [Chelativorans sp. Marseille-P2723]|uniref:GNAT family N-acetyltransferase n=1 Tax=Chelativorans sp. Marseille-P2723 TaxID=2709133 RepID=UPI00156DF171|nr:GNAT family N-acetyltransferase [Chelativorans sp. Marseille-P2723]